MTVTLIIFLGYLLVGAVCSALVYRQRMWTTNGAGEPYRRRELLYDDRRDVVAWLLIWPAMIPVRATVNLVEAFSRREPRWVKLKRKELELAQLERDLDDRRDVLDLLDPDIWGYKR